MGTQGSDPLRITIRVNRMQERRSRLLRSSQKEKTPVFKHQRRDWESLRVSIHPHRPTNQTRVSAALELTSAICLKRRGPGRRTGAHRSYGISIAARSDRHKTVEIRTSPRVAVSTFQTEDSDSFVFGRRKLRCKPALLACIIKLPI